MTDGKKAERLERRKILLERRAEEVAKLNTDVRERLIFLIYLQCPRGSRYEYLEQRYGIAARKWQNVCNRVQLPGIDMLSSILRDHPHYATWLMLGVAMNRRKLISSAGGKVTTGTELQTNPSEEYGFHETDEGLIDPTINGWEKKLENALWQKMIQNSPNPAATKKRIAKPDPPQRP